MERELPVINIKGTNYVVDVVKRELRQADSRENSLSFDSMEYKDDHYEFSFDPVSKNFFFFDTYRSGLPRDANGQLVYKFPEENFLENFNRLASDYHVSIPQMVELDPQGMADHYKVPLKELSGKTDYEIIVDQELVDKRLSGFLPVIDILGHPFFVDIRMGVIRPKDDFSTSGIRFDDMSETDTSLRFLYDPKTHNIPVHYYENSVPRLPEGLFIVKVPKEIDLDPVGFARHFDLDFKPFLIKYPPQKTLKAEVIPWIETSVHQTNKETLENDSKTQKKRAPKKNRGNKL